MNCSLTGRVILIAEDEPHIAFEMTLALEDEGALVIRAHTLKQARAGVEDPKLSAAILDHALSDGDTSAVCERMKERNIPFVIYSGYDQRADAARDIVYVRKPVDMPTLIAIVQRAIAERQTPNQHQLWVIKSPPGAAAGRRNLRLP